MREPERKTGDLWEVQEECRRTSSGVGGGRRGASQSRGQQSPQQPGLKKAGRGSLDVCLSLTGMTSFGFMSTNIYLECEKLPGTVFPSMELLHVYRAFFSSQAWICK